MNQSTSACPSCGASATSQQRFCGGCGAVLSRTEALTVTGAPTGTDSPRIASGGARFLPGQMLADRYRMVGLLGAGGMGEVYRADDLKLGQPVALKFLPPAVEADPLRLERFLTEVRLSLRVTHPNVCRVFDIGQAALPAGSGWGGHFLSMEYVDGEDLASLLRRIGRLPEDKALEIARQLCAGLQAAHDEGVLHRDLKPANVMIDGRGRTKITDFGLAGATVGIAGLEARAGTPQYMAPEQFDGRELSVQTDIYSLGLVLYELFTGKRAFDSQDVIELAQMRSSTPTTPSAFVTGLDPVIERAILRCLDPDPAARPRSASALAAALPGGDPLAMAVAAGETPSPDMIARAGGRGELRPALAVTCLVLVFVGLAAAWYHEGRYSFVNRVPMPKAPAELRVAARAALAAAGYVEPPVSTAQGFQQDQEYFHKTEREKPGPDRWDDLATLSPAPVWFWYRESARPISPAADLGTVGVNNPPMHVPGMKRVRVDPSGRLQELMIVPADLPEPGAAAAEPDWDPLFRAAGSEPHEWQSAEPMWPPPQASDLRRAWTRGDVRIEAAAFRGRPVWFRVVPAWRQGTPATPPARPWLGALATDILFVTVTVAGAWLARRNTRLGRGDQRGAFRTAAAYLVVSTGFHLLRLPSNPVSWAGVLTNNVAVDVYYAVIVWLFYMAVEPYVRRLWPHTLITWTRLINGQFRDPLVGRHALVGALAGLGMTGVFLLPNLILPLTGRGIPDPHIHTFDGLASSRVLAAQFLDVLRISFFIPVSLLLVVMLLRSVFRSPAVAYTVLFAVLGGFLLLIPGSWVDTIATLGTVALATVILSRLGLVALVVCIVFSSWPFFYLTTDASSWYFPSSVATMMVFAAAAMYAFRVSLGGQKVFTDAILDPSPATK